MKRKSPEQLEQESADIEASGRAESEKRREKIKRLLDLPEEDLKAKTYKSRKLKVKAYKERKLKRAIAKEGKLHELQNCVKLVAFGEEGKMRTLAKAADARGTSKSLQVWMPPPSNRVRELEEIFDELGVPWQKICELVDWLTEFACLQDREIEYLAESDRELERIRRYHPEQLRQLSSASLIAELRPAIEKLHAERNPSQKWEHGKRRSPTPEYYSIEYQFGGKGEAAWRKGSYGRSKPYQPTCFVKIVTGASLNMRELQDLFWPLGRDRLSKYVQSYSYKNGTEVLYRPPAVPMIIKALLSEGDEPAKRKRAQGKARRIWLNEPKNPDLRIRVLRGIEAHIKSFANWLLSIAREETDLSKLTDEEFALVSFVFEHFRGCREWQTKVAGPILNVLSPYLSDSAD